LKQAKRRAGPGFKSRQLHQVYICWVYSWWGWAGHRQAD